MDYLFSLHGRLNRARYWTAVVIYLVAFAIGGILAAVLGMVGFILLGLIYLAAVVSGVMVARLRLHDRDKSGWWLVLFYFGPSVLSAAARGGLGDGLGSGAISLILELAAAALAIWAIVELGFLRGTVGANRFGPDPLAPSAQAPAPAAPAV
ncbi:MAG TPA: DUF805 domain-containing protein [Hyphomicrobiales bacterium]|nr:DUF805 domain-containing protein [Hyphomicrobiales bacterium]